MRLAALTCLLFKTPHLPPSRCYGAAGNPLPSRQEEGRTETRGSYRTVMHSVSYDALRQRRCAKIKFHSTNFLIALVMEATPARRVENIAAPITRRFLIRRTFLFSSGNFVEQRNQRKSERSKRCKRIAKELLVPRFFEIHYLPIDRQTSIHGKSFKQDLSWASRSTEPWC